MKHYSTFSELPPVPVDQYAAYVRRLHDKTFGVRPNIVRRPPPAAPAAVAAEPPPPAPKPPVPRKPDVRVQLKAKLAELRAARKERDEAALRGNMLKGREVLCQVSDEFGVSILDLLSARQTARITLVRQWAIYRCRVETPLSCTQIGTLFHRDHTTVLHAVKKIEKKLAEGKL